MNAPRSGEGETSGSTPLSGALYSRILVFRCRDDLNEILGRDPTNDEVARYVGATAEEVDTVMTRQKTFGAPLLQRLATANDQTFIEFMADLARWSRENLG